MPGAFSPGEVERLVAGAYPGARLSRYWPLDGGVSARMAAVEVITNEDQVVRFVARLHGEWERQHNPEIAALEFRVLGQLHHAGIPVPKPVALDDRACEAPVIIIEYLTGKALSSPMDVPADPPDLARKAARVLRRVHDLRLPATDDLPDGIAWANDLVDAGTGSTNEDFMETRLREALESAWPPPRCDRLCLLHGDYWPGNLMFHGGQLQAVLDWEEVMLGDPLMDAAIARLEFAWMWGIAASDAFSHSYFAGGDPDPVRLAIWDLFAALRMARGIAWWGFDETDWGLARDGHKAFSERALAVVTRF